MSLIFRSCNFPVYVPVKKWPSIKLSFFLDIQSAGLLSLATPLLHTLCRSLTNQTKLVPIQSLRKNILEKSQNHIKETRR